MENNFTIPDDMMEEILLRLPVKCLLRFKYVCKSWLSLISDPHFAKFHYDLGADPTDQLLIKSYWETHSRDIEASLYDDSTKAVVNIPYPSPSYIDEGIKFEGSCRGFLLVTTTVVSSGKVVYFMIWNPSTGLRKRFNKVFPTLEYLRGIGYDPSTDDYVVVMIRLGQEVQCFSLRSNSWSRFEGTLPFRKNTSVTHTHALLNGSYLNGALHWLVYSYDYYFKIIAFDLVERKLFEIPLPRQFVEHRCCLIVMGGCLCLFCTTYVPAQPAQMWMMKEYNVQSSWTKTVVVSAEDVIYGRYFFPICITASGDIVGKDLGTGLVKCSGKGHLREHRSYFNGQCGYEVALYTESLLSLPCDSKPSKQAEEDDKQ